MTQPITRSESDKNITTLKEIYNEECKKIPAKHCPKLVSSKECLEAGLTNKLYATQYQLVMS